MRRAVVSLTPIPSRFNTTVATHIAAIHAERDAFVAAVKARRQAMEEGLPAEVMKWKGEACLSLPGALSTSAAAHQHL